ncbi:tripartite tricarboxylate transporter substrate binding protein [Defluviitalea phaphyphila]|uniref:tripartite tricarboxylate transporter substrate binding protein n=1 Tax=Defluviitalea phaphyphila TaxID=1473580 RepID=UPI0007317371|nr:tripartite tricarboxylate transporter substrate binding protein [Defluviitalea phaphyphila]
MKTLKRILVSATIISILMTAIVGCSNSTTSNDTSTNSTGNETNETDSAKNEFPEKTIEIIVPFGAGGGADISVRNLAKYAEKELGQTIIINNVTGGSGTVGLTQLSQAKADGYKLGYFASTNSNDNLLFEGITYDVDSFKPIIIFSADPHIIVASKKSGITNMEELKAKAAENEESVSLGLGGAWTSHDFLRMSLEEELDVKFKRVVYQGGAGAVTAVANGDCDVAVPFVSEAIAQIEAGNIVPIAITSDERFELVPDIPTIKEQGFDYTHVMWRAIVAPAGTPDEVVEILADAFEAAYENPEYQEAAKESGVFSKLMVGEELDNFYLVNHEKYRRMIESGIE